MHNAVRYVLGGFAGAAIVTGVSIAVATAGNTTTPAPEHATASQEAPAGFLARLAAKLGISEEELRSAIEETIAEEIDAAEERGAIPEDVAERLRDWLERGALEGSLFDWELDDVQGLPAVPGLDSIRGDLEELRREIAEFLGTTEEEIRRLLEEGMPLSEIVAESGRTPEEIAQFLLDRFLEHADSDVPEGVRTLMREALERMVELYLEGRLTLESLLEGGWPGFGAGP